MATYLNSMWLVILSANLYAYNASYVKDKARNDLINPNVFAAMASVESNFNPRAIGDDNKSFGIMQISIPAARHMGFKGPAKALMNPEINIRISVKYLTYLFIETSSLYVALDAYNRGLGNVRKFPYNGLYENHPYVGKIIKILKGE